MTRLIRAIAMLVFAAACRPPRAPDPATTHSGAARDTIILGVVRVAGAVPLTTVLIRASDTGTEVGIRGNQRAEIGSLAGVEIAARGELVRASLPGPTYALEVQSYDVVAVGDIPAFSGTLIVRDAEYWVAGRDTLELSHPVPDQLTKLRGRRVYVAGVRDGGRIRVQAFGAIRDRR